MKLVALKNENTNTNTLTLNVETPITINALLSKEEVQRFSQDISAEDIITMDGADLSAVSTIGDLMVTDDTVLEADVEGSYEPRQAAVPVQGKVEVLTGGGSVRKKVIIVDGVSTVRQALTDGVAAAFGKTKAELQNMKAHLNDTECTLEAVLHDGDKIVLEERKAGTDGADPYLRVVDASGTVREYPVEDLVTTLRDFLLDEVMGDFGIEEDELIDDIEYIDDEDFSNMSERVQCLMLDQSVGDFAEVTFQHYMFDVPEEEESEEEAAEVADGVSASQVTPATGFATAGSITVSQGGAHTVKMVVVSGQTTVRDVVLSNKILNTFAMTESQMRQMIFNVNDVRSELDQVLRAGDSLVIEAPKCGTDGNC